MLRPPPLLVVPVLGLLGLGALAPDPEPPGRRAPVATPAARSADTLALDAPDAPAPDEPAPVASVEVSAPSSQPPESGPGDAPDEAPTAEPCAVRVRVVDHDHQPLAGAGIVSTDGGDLVSATTDAGGQAVLVFAGQRGFRVRAAGHVTTRLWLAAASRAEPCEVVLRPEAVIRGLVLGPDGRPAVGAVVRSDGEEPVECDAEGRFVLTGLDEGSHTVAAERAGSPLLVSLGRSVSAPLGRVTEVQLELLAVDDRLEVSVLTADGRLIEGEDEGELDVWVAGRWLCSGTRCAPLDVPFEVRARVGALGGQALVRPGERRVVVRLEPARRLEGRIDRPPSARPRRAERVTFRPDGPGYVSDFVVNDRFSLEVPRDRGGAVWVRLASGESIERQVSPGEAGPVVLSPRPGTANGAVEWPGAKVRGSIDGRTFRDGPSLPPGPQLLVAVARDGAPLAATARVEVRSGVALRLGAPLLPACRVRGRLVDPLGRPVPSAVVLAGQVGSPGLDGWFDLVAPPGRWTLSLARDPAFVAARFEGATRARFPARALNVPVGVLDLGELVVEVE